MRLTRYDFLVWFATVAFFAILDWAIIALDTGKMMWWR